MRQGGSLLIANKSLVKVQYKLQKNHSYWIARLSNIICLLDELLPTLVCTVESRFLDHSVLQTNYFAFTCTKGLKIPEATVLSKQESVCL